MEDDRHTSPWPGARTPAPAGREDSDDSEATLSRNHATPPGARTDESALRGTLLDDRYRLAGCIGTGGMSQVYSGVHVKTGVRVAIKLIYVVMESEQAPPGGTP